METKAEGIAHVEDRELAGMGPRDRFEALDALELAFERPRVAESAAVDDLYRAQFPEDVARKPHLAVAAAANRAKQFVVGNPRLRQGPVANPLRPGD